MNSKVVAVLMFRHSSSIYYCIIVNYWISSGKGLPKKYMLLFMGRWLCAMLGCGSSDTQILFNSFWVIQSHSKFVSLHEGASRSHKTVILVIKANKACVRSNLYLCHMCIDHNSPAAGWVLGVARQAHRVLHTSWQVYRSGCFQWKTRAILSWKWN